MIFFFLYLKKFNGGIPMVNRLTRCKEINLLLVVSVLFSFLVVPYISEANPIDKLKQIDLSKTKNAVIPWARLAGKITGAVAGAVFCSAAVPPLGFLAGGVAGWMAGGMMVDYATKSPGNLAVFVGGALGVVALASLGPVGYIVGGLIGAGLGKLAVNLIQKAKDETIGNRAAPAGTSSATSTNVAPVAFSTSVLPVATNRSVSASSAEIRQAEQDYQSAYRAYVSASSEGKDISEAHKLYQKALETYRRVTGKNP